MIYDRIAPLLPTSAPVMIKRLLSRRKPLALVAHPEYEFNIDTMTGISAAPIARIRWKPKKILKPVLMYNQNTCLSSRQKNTPQVTIASIIIKLRRCLKLPMHVRGPSHNPLHRPANLIKAITEPENVMAPTHKPI